MRVLYFTRDYTPHDYRFLSSLAMNSPHQVFALRLEKSALPREDRPFPSQVEQVTWKGGSKPIERRDYLPLLADFRRVVSSLKVDLVHAGPIQKTAFLAALGGSRSVPLVSMSWGSDMLVDAERDGWQRWITRFTLRRTAVFLADCYAVARKAVQFGFPETQIVVFPWGVDLEAFSPGKDWQSAPAEIATELEKRRPFRLLCVRAWEPIYGVDIVVRAFARLAPQIPELHLTLVGDGSQAGLIRSILLQHNLLERVTLVGQVKNHQLPDYYRSADLYLSASHSDGSSVSLMEALACGCPVLVSNIAGNREWITDGEQGWLFPDGDEVALADGILHAFQQRGKLRLMAEKARCLAEQRADWRANFKLLLKAYEMAVYR